MEIDVAKSRKPICRGVIEMHATAKWLTPACFCYPYRPKHSAQAIAQPLHAACGALPLLVAS